MKTPPRPISEPGTVPAEYGVRPVPRDDPFSTISFRDDGSCDLWFGGVRFPAALKLLDVYVADRVAREKRRTAGEIEYGSWSGPPEQ